MSRAWAAVAVWGLVGCGAAIQGTTGHPQPVTGKQTELHRVRGRFELFEAQDGQVGFHLLAGHGEKVFASEKYASRSDAEAGLASIQLSAADPSRFTLRQAQGGAWYFVLQADLADPAVEVLGVSETYVSEANAQRAFEALQELIVSADGFAPAELSASRVELFEREDGQFYFHLRARNGEIVLQSEVYSTRNSAAAGVAAIRENGAFEERYQVRQAANGRAYFVLRALNNHVIGRSQIYPSEAAAKAAIISCVAVMIGSQS